MPRHYAVQAAQTLNVDTAAPQYRHSYIIGSGIVNHHRIIRFERQPNILTFFAVISKQSAYLLFA